MQLAFVGPGNDQLPNLDLHFDTTLPFMRHLVIAVAWFVSAIPVGRMVNKRSTGWSATEE
jgi:hypothetical protein